MDNYDEKLNYSFEPADPVPAEPAQPLQQVKEEIRRSGRVLREYRFTLLMDAALYDPSAQAGDEMLLQGVVDCCFETETGLTVVDFKTDRVRTPEEVSERAERYRPQLEAYSRALERVLERPVTRRVLYFLVPGSGVDL